jgi:predicted ATPase/DNA-binding CsgD family transcriptional regulator
LGEGTGASGPLGGRIGSVTVLPGAARPGNLPEQLSSFVGRERELAELREALAESRLVTLTGPGGCGKTRLALRLASQVLDWFPGGVWWVELAPLAEADLVGAAITASLGVRPLPGRTPLQAAGAYLGPRRSLVVLDNCEHLVGACAEAAEALLRAAPDVAVVATSRTPLGAGGETDWRVPPLSLPNLEERRPRDGLAASDAVRLFVERARKARPGFVVTDQNGGAVAEICTALDGQPLAIELAAARVRLLSAEQIAAGLADRFGLLTAGPRTAAARLQTLRASVDWSHDLLSGPEQMLLRRVAVFAGGFTLDAVEQVCAGDGIERGRILDLLGSLVDQSLVIAEERHAGMRYRLLETVRQYGLERLDVAGEGDTLRGRHCDTFLALAERAGPQLETGRQRQWLEILDPEAANLAAAIECALRSNPRLALRFCATLQRWWNVRGRFAEAEMAMARSLDACRDREPALRARVLLGRGYVAINAGKSKAADSHATEALALAEEVGDRATAARARCQRGGAMQHANPRAARAELEGAAELARTARDDWVFVTANQLIAATYLYQHDHTRCARANDDVAALAERLGDPLHVARHWFLAGWMAITDGRFTEAHDAVAWMRAVNAIEEPIVDGWADAWLALLEIWGGEPERALERLEGQLAHVLKLGAGMVVPLLSAEMAFAELAAGRLGQASNRLHGLLPLVEGRAGYITSWAWGLLAEARRLLGDDAADATARHAQASGEKIGNRLLATRACLTLGRLAAGRGDWTTAQQHALAHLDACVDGGHATYVPACLDALAEVAAGLGSDQDAVRLFAAAERARAEIGVVRIPPEDQHWAAIDTQLRAELGDDAYDTARAQGAELSTQDALEWARRARGPRRRPPSGWASLTPTEAKVVELVAQGLTNRQISDRMFISTGTAKAHLAHIFKKLDVHNRAELSAHAVQQTTTG